jgi:hypothetical protein
MAAAADGDWKPNTRRKPLRKRKRKLNSSHTTTRKKSIPTTTCRGIGNTIRLLKIILKIIPQKINRHLSKRLAKCVNGRDRECRSPRKKTETMCYKCKEFLSMVTEEQKEIMKQLQVGKDEELVNHIGEKGGYL